MLPAPAQATARASAGNWSSAAAGAIRARAGGVPIMLLLQLPVHQSKAAVAACRQSWVTAIQRGAARLRKTADRFCVWQSAGGFIDRRHSGRPFSAFHCCSPPNAGNDGRLPALTVRPTLRPVSAISPRSSAGARFRRSHYKEPGSA